MNNAAHRVVMVVILGLFLVPSTGEASHSKKYGVDVSDLDDDPVEEFNIPVLFGVELDEVVPDYGDPRGGGTREHEGQDFIVPLGTPIVSPTEAVVLRTGTGASAGKYVYTANPGGEIFRYMHLDYIADLDEGDELDEGDFIGTVGDTGNAVAGQYHLHFEVRDEDNDATDPYDRLGGTYSLKERMSFLRDVFRDIRDDEEYAELLVSEFEADFVEAYEKGYWMPNDIEDILEDSDIDERLELLAQLNELIDTIPTILVRDLGNGDSGTEVSLLQTYLILRSEGAARDRLAAAGATGYYGSITADAVLEWQEEIDAKETGQWDSQTRRELAE